MPGPEINRLVMMVGGSAEDASSEWGPQKLSLQNFRNFRAELS